jgi:hypothetical protein
MMATPRANLVGQRFGHLLALEPAGVNAQGRLLWLCRCDCGNEIKVPCGNLARSKKRIRHCGCLTRPVADKAVKQRRYKTKWQRAARAEKKVVKVGIPAVRHNGGPIDRFLYAHPAPVECAAVKP